MAVDLDLNGRNVFITGATSGLGQRFATAFAGQGANVVITGRRIERLGALASELRATGVKVLPIAMDVTDRDGVEASVAHAEAELGPLWALINNSGVTVQGPAESASEADYDFVMDTNVKGAFLCAQAVGRRLIERKAGRVVNIASLAALKVMGQLAIYCTSKAAVAQMTKALALEWARSEVNVNAICPGYIETEMNSAFFHSEHGQKFMRSFPRRRIGRPEDLDELVLYLASPCSRFITGSVIAADDGQGLA